MFRRGSALGDVVAHQRALRNYQRASPFGNERKMAADVGAPEFTRGTKGFPEEVPGGINMGVD